MSLDVSDAVALAKDLLETSGEFQAHDPALAAQFANRAFEICDDLGIDRTEIGSPPSLAAARSLRDEAGKTADAEAPVVIETRSAEFEDDTQQAGDQLQALLQQQAQVLQNVRGQHARDAETVTKPPKVTRRSFWPFGRQAQQETLGARALQSA